MATRTTTAARKTTKATTSKTAERRPFDTGGRPAGNGKGGVVTRHGGSTTSYQKGCRCSECRTAATDAKRRARDRKRQAAEVEATAKAEKAARAKARRAAKTTS